MAEPVVEPKVEIVPTEQVQETVVKTSPSKDDMLREISKELGINAFKPEEVKAKFDEFTKWKDAQKSEQEKIQEQLEEANRIANDSNKSVAKLQAEVIGLKLGIPEDKLDDALALAKNNISDGQTIEDGLKAIQTKYKDMFVKAQGVTLTVGTQTGDNNPNNNKPIDPALARYLARQKKK